MTYITCIKALSNDSRRAIVEGLRQGPRSVNELAGAMPISQPAVSQHLRVLMEAGLVQCSHQGTRHIYSVRPAGLDELRRYIESYWDEVLDAFAGRPGATVGQDEDPSEEQE